MILSVLKMRIPGLGGKVVGAARSWPRPAEPSFSHRVAFYFLIAAAFIHPFF
jgi:hypothetical protein